MDIYSIAEGPLLWMVLILFSAGFLMRLTFFAVSVLRNRRLYHQFQAATISIFGRLFIPLHKAFLRRPFYTTLRYMFHICLLVLPIWVSGHIVLWSESRFEWDWAPLPEAWADWMTIGCLAFLSFFLLRRLFSAEARRRTTIRDVVLILITALPFATGYFLTHGTLARIGFLGDNMIIWHMLSGELMIVAALCLFYAPRLNAQKCTGCASCVQNCLTRTLQSEDHGNQRVFNYAHFLCICCGNCVNICPEGALDIRHEINPRRLVEMFSSRQIATSTLMTCKRCGAFYAPEPQLEKICATCHHDHLKFCPDCRQRNIGDRLKQLSPWHKTQPPVEAHETISREQP